jgi:DNA-directed RNA polymerase specialized sigma24 family protein
MRVHQPMDWPTDPTTLADLAANLDQAAALRDRAARDLQPFLVEMARRIAGRWNRWGADVIDELVSHAALKNLKIEPRPRQFEPWCYTVMKNRFRDWVRHNRHDPLNHLAPETFVADNQPDPGLAHFQSELEYALDRQAPFSPRDLARIGAWKPQQRLVLLCLSLLWRKVPPDVWRQWADQCGLGPGFPPPEFEDHLGPHERTTALAGLMGLQRNTLYKIWTRNRGELGALDYLKALHDET